MTKVILSAALAALVAGCGVDGPPQPPLNSNGTRPPAISIQGEARVGVSGSF